ncbi:MAG: response regulator [Nitrososphaera sp.]
MRILVAEDEESIALVYKAVLESLGHEVIIVADGEQCLQTLYAAADHSESFNIVILDHRMPKKSGVSVAAEIQLHWPNQKVIMLSAYVEDVIHATMQDLEHPVVCLQKPIDLDLFGSIVEDEAELHASSGNLGPSEPQLAVSRKSISKDTDAA